MKMRSVVITGGNKGIGLDITKCFLKKNYVVIVGARQKTKIISKLGPKVHFLSIDASKEESHKILVNKAIELTGSLDVYINNVGVSEWMPIQKINEHFIDSLISTNLKSAFWGCKAAINNMKLGSSIINISSIAGKRGSANNSVYSATKFAMNGLTQSLAKEVGNKGIRVNALCPVLVSTDGLLSALNSEYSPAKGNPEKFLNDFKNSNSALNRLPTGNEVGDMCVFLASKKSSAITGQCINVDCGVLPQ